MTINVNAMFHDGTALALQVVGWREATMLGRWLCRQGAQVTFSA